MTQNKKPGLLARAALAILRRSAGFQAAKYGRLNMGWSRRASSLSANELIFRDLPTLVANSREQSINNPYAKRFYSLLKTKAIGPRGFNHQNRAKVAGDKPDLVTNDLIEASWKSWSKKGICDVSGRYSLTRFLHLWVETLARDGEVLVREYAGFQNRFGYALQILEADRLDRKLNADLSNGNIIRMGVEIDEFERPVAYHLLTNHPGDRSLILNGQTYDRIPADEIIHTFDPWRPHQVRGFPWMHASMVDLHHLGEYRQAEMVAAEYSAKNVGFFEQDAEYIDAPATSSDDQGEIAEEVEAGSWSLLPYGIRAKEGFSNHPHSNFGEFIGNSLRGAASGTNISYPRLTNDATGLSWSSLRDTELDDRDFYKLVQGIVVEDLLERIRTSWLKMSMLTGAVKIPFAEFDRVNQPHFQPRGWSWVSPKDESTAHKTSLANRTMTRASIIRERGEDPEDVFEEMEWEEKMLDAKGLLTTETKGNGKEDTKTKTENVASSTSGSSGSDSKK